MICPDSRDLPLWRDAVKRPIWDFTGPFTAV